MAKISRILWTWSWNGFSIERVDGKRESVSPSQLLAEVGQAEFDRLNKIAHEFPCNCYKNV